MTTINHNQILVAGVTNFIFYDLTKALIAAIGNNENIVIDSDKYYIKLTFIKEQVVYQFGRTIPLELCSAIYTGPLNMMYKHEGFPRDVINEEKIAFVTVGTSKGYLAVNNTFDFIPGYNPHGGRLQQLLCLFDSQYPAPKEENISIDAEFEKFMQLFDAHDRYYSYSDDAGVWRRGKAQEEALLSFVNKYGGKFKQVWEGRFSKNAPT